MAIFTDEFGRNLYRRTPETDGLSGRFFKRREPVGDASDTITVLGASTFGTIDEPEHRLIVSCAAFGAIPEGWDSAIVTAPLDGFAATYTEMTADERDALAAAEARASARATQTAVRAREAERQAERDKLAQALAKAIKEQP